MGAGWGRVGSLNGGGGGGQRREEERKVKRVLGAELIPGGCTRFVPWFMRRWLREDQWLFPLTTKMKALFNHEGWLTSMVIANRRSERTSSVSRRTDGTSGCHLVFVRKGQA